MGAGASGDVVTGVVDSGVAGVVLSGVVDSGVEVAGAAVDEGRGEREACLGGVLQGEVLLLLKAGDLHLLRHCFLGRGALGVGANSSLSLFLSHTWAAGWLWRLGDVRFFFCWLGGAAAGVMESGRRLPVVALLAAWLAVVAGGTFSRLSTCWYMATWKWSVWLCFASQCLARSRYLVDPTCLGQNLHCQANFSWCCSAKCLSLPLALSPRK